MSTLHHPRSFSDGTGILCRMSVALAVAVVTSSALQAAESSPVSSGQSGRTPSAADVPRVSPEPDPASRNMAARARTLECGHQWSNMKKAGTASGTYKEFYRNCLAQK